VPEIAYEQRDARVVRPKKSICDQGTGRFRLQQQGSRGSAKGILEFMQDVFRWLLK